MQTLPWSFGLRDQNESHDISTENGGFDTSSRIAKGLVQEVSFLLYSQSLQELCNFEKSYRGGFTMELGKCPLKKDTRRIGHFFTILLKQKVSISLIAE